MRFRYYVLCITLFLFVIDGYAKKRKSTCNGEFTIEYSDSIYHIGKFDSLNNKTGDWITYKNGEIIRITRWASGKLNGNMIFFRNGVVFKEIMFTNGIIDGVAKFYSSDGYLLAIYKYHFGIRECVLYYAFDEESPPNNETFVPSY